MLPFFAKLVRIVLVLTTVLLIWFGAMAAAMFIPNNDFAALAVIQDETILNRLPQGTRLVRSGNHTMVFASTNRYYVFDLYAAGALLVLPSLRNGCLDLSNALTQVR